MDPVQYWAATSGLTPQSEKKSSMPFANFSSNVARDYGKSFGGHGSQYGFTPTAGFEPVQNATRSMVQDFLSQQKFATDMASNALNAIGNIRIAGMAPEQQGGGGAPQKKSSGGLGSTLLNTAVGAAVPAVIGLV